MSSVHIEILWALFFISFVDMSFRCVVSLSIYRNIILFLILLFLRITLHGLMLWSYSVAHFYLRWVFLEFLGGRWVQRAFSVSLFLVFMNSQGIGMWLVLAETSGCVHHQPPSFLCLIVSDLLILDSIPSSLSSMWGFVLEGSLAGQVGSASLALTTSWVWKACPIFTAGLRLAPVFSGEWF